MALAMAGDTAKVPGLADALGAERPGALVGLDRLVLHRRNVEDARDLVVGERGVGDLAAVELASSPAW